MRISQPYTSQVYLSDVYLGGVYFTSGGIYFTLGGVHLTHRRTSKVILYIGVHLGQSHMAMHLIYGCASYLAVHPIYSCASYMWLRISDTGVYWK